MCGHVVFMPMFLLKIHYSQRPIALVLSMSVYEYISGSQVKVQGKEVQGQRQKNVEQGSYMSPPSGAQKNVPPIVHG